MDEGEALSPAAYRVLNKFESSAYMKDMRYSPLIFIALLPCLAVAADAQQTTLEYAPAPVDNPLKGLVPYSGDHRAQFPHSMEFNYLPLSAVVVDENKYDWAPLENLLNDVATRGHQTVVRFFLEYPGKKGGIPEYLLKGGLKVETYVNTNAQISAPSEVSTPDYADTHLRLMLKNFIAEFGKKYDGDVRLGYITAGLLGTWGEWHDWPRDELFAKKDVQAEVMDAYEAAFKTTPVLLRYPAGERHNAHAPNAARKFGFHDDSFGWSTLDTGKKSDGWFFVTATKAAGKDALDKWKTYPIGGEIRPEAWGIVFDENPGIKEIQNYRQCVNETHATWMMDSGMFRKKQDATRIQRAEDEVRHMGYEFFIHSDTISLSDRKLSVKIEIENRGVAPIYCDWPAEFGLIGANGQIAKTFAGAGKLRGLLPGDAPREWADELDATGVVAGKYKLALHVPNPLKNGHPVGFANKTQDADVKGWVTLGAVELK